MARAEIPPPEMETIPPPPAEPSRYVLLAAYSEQGTAPPALQSNSGFLAVELPAGSSLTTLFQTGQQYRFTSDHFDGFYRVLETYPTKQQAYLVYPEGLPVDPSKGAFLHWSSLDDPTSANASAWTALH